MKWLSFRAIRFCLPVANLLPQKLRGHLLEIRDAQQSGIIIGIDDHPGSENLGNPEKESDEVIAEPVRPFAKRPGKAGPGPRVRPLWRNLHTPPLVGANPRWMHPPEAVPPKSSRTTMCKLHII